VEKKHFCYTVTLAVTITRKEIEDIIKVAETHYDAVCKEFAATTLQNMLDSRMMAYPTWPNRGKTTPLDVCEYVFEFRELDTICKILEQEHHVEGVRLFDTYYAHLTSINKEWQRVNAFWAVFDTEVYTDQYRADLKARYPNQQIIPEGSTDVSIGAPIKT
jgi:hypothetical protein